MGAQYLSERAFELSKTSCSMRLIWENHPTRWTAAPHALKWRNYARRRRPTWLARAAHQHMLPIRFHRRHQLLAVEFSHPQMLLHHTVLRHLTLHLHMRAPPVVIQLTAA